NGRIRVTSSPIDVLACHLEHITSPEVRGVPVSGELGRGTVEVSGHLGAHIAALNDDQTGTPDTRMRARTRGLLSKMRQLLRFPVSTTLTSMLPSGGHPVPH